MKISITTLRKDLYQKVLNLKKTGDVEITYKGKVVAKLVEVKDDNN